MAFLGPDELFNVPLQWGHLKSHMLWPPRQNHVIIDILTVLLNTKKLKNTAEKLKNTADKELEAR